MPVELKRETILAALAVALGNVARNIPLGELVDGQPYRALHDGTAEVVEEFINPPITEWTIRPSLMLVLQWSGDTSPDAELAALIGAAADQVAAIDDQLGGLVTDIRVQAPDFEPKALWGLPNAKGAEVTIEIDYWSETSLG